MSQSEGPRLVFNYRGEIPASKSILNRLLICQSFSPSRQSLLGGDEGPGIGLKSGFSGESQAGSQPDANPNLNLNPNPNTNLNLNLNPESGPSANTGLRVLGESQCDDVVKMRQGLQDLFEGKVVDCGAAGTTFRFLSLKASRLPGTHRLTGTRRLLSRPQQSLIDITAQLGVQMQVGEDEVRVISRGWVQPSGPVLVDRSQSSQFLSALVLSSWDLPFDLKLKMVGGDLSEGYWQMTRELVERLGMKLEWNPDSSELLIGQGQQINCAEIRAESDLSSAFAVAAFAALGGEVELLNFPLQSLQPDVAFIEILRQMGVKVELIQGARSNSSGSLRLSQELGRHLRPIEVDLGNCPDLFPVLAVLCAFSEGTCRLYGAPQLVHKESNRIAKVAELIQIMGRSCEPKPDGMLIEGRAPDLLSASFASTSFASTSTPVPFDPDHDHRLAFASALAAHAGCAVEVTDPSVVNKSFPEFWQVVQQGQAPQDKTSQDKTSQDKTSQDAL